LPTRLRHSTIASSSQSQEHSQGVPIVPADTEETCGSGYDAVPLGGLSSASRCNWRRALASSGILLEFPNH